MAKARALDKRRKSIRNIRKITRTMELIATARFKKAMDRADAATAYTERITQLVADLVASGMEVSIRCWQVARIPSGQRCWCCRPIAGCAAATIRSVQRAAIAAISGTAGTGTGRSIGSVRQTWHCRLPLSRIRRRNIHALRRQAELCRSRRAGQPLFASLCGRPARSARRGLHAVRERQPAERDGRDIASAGFAGLPRRGKGGRSSGAGRARSGTSFCPRPKASWTKSCRRALK